MKTIRYLAEYFALRMIAGLVDILPYRAALFLGWLNAIVTFALFNGRVREARRRIRQVFGDRYSGFEITHIVWQSWRNMVFGAIEMVRLHKMTLDWMNHYSDSTHVMDVLKKHAATGRGAVVTCAHTGSWELAAVTSQLNGIPIFTFAAKQKNPFTDAYLNELRRSTGIETISRDAGMLKDLLRNLKSGKMLAILPDVRMPVEALRVPFLGGEANVGDGLAGFAKHADVPIFPCICTRIGWARHKIEIYDTILPDKNISREEDVRRMMNIVMKIIDDAIHHDPGQWFWFNKRWILDPVQPKRPTGSDRESGN